MATQQEQLIAVLEDTASLFNKTQTNLRKCPKARLTKGYLEARIQIIEEYWQKFINAHWELQKCTPKEQRGTLKYFLNEEYFIYEDLYNVLHGDLTDMLSSFTTPRNSSNTTAETCDFADHKNSILHLPKIQLPTFNGSYESWPTFQDTFISLIHESKSLSDVQKLHYLKSSITGEAESLLKHIQVISSNYIPAWNILKERYGNKRLILNCNMKRLFNQKKMTTQSANQLKGLLDTTTETLNNLKNLNINTASWDPIIIHLLVQKLDPETHKNWEEYVSRDISTELPTWTEFKDFLEKKFRTLELVTATTSTTVREVKQVKERTFHVATPSTSRICQMCQENHTLCHCKEFIKLEPKERSEYVKSKQLCFNCLAPGHPSRKCKLHMSCRICKGRHHSLLHENRSTETTGTTNDSPPLASQHVVEEEEEEILVNTMTSSQRSAGQNIALLATAIVEATNEEGLTIPLRALIDQGSQATFISEKAAQLLKLKRKPIKVSVIGVGSTRTEIKDVVQLNIRSRWDAKTSLPIQAYVMSKQLTTMMPTRTVPVQSWPHLEGLNLADPTYFTPGSIDLLLGVKEYSRILQQDLIKGPSGSPCAQKTSLGWILFGNVAANQHDDSYVVMHHHVDVDVDDMLKSIWEIETDDKRHLTKEEKQCEEIYVKTTARNEEGRYIVKLPFKTDSPQSSNGNTKEIARQRFTQLEKRFRRSPDLKKEYTKVMNDYIEQKHVEKIPEKERENKRSVYLPHHAVIRNDKETTRTRTVFDASCKGSNNVSLNDELLVGPQLQEDLRNLLIRWRMKRICFVADIQKMYRQILVFKEDADFQRFFWRSDESKELQEYRHLRVTFGTAPAPFLAVRTLHQVAEDEGNGNTLAIETIKNSFYMDDLFDGAVVANRVVEILENLNNKHWHHVESSQNPADLASRGMLLSELKQCDLWWRGPGWLSEKEIKISKEQNMTTDLEMKTKTVNTYLNTEDTGEHETPITEQFKNFEKLSEMTKILTYCRKFLNYKKSKENTDNAITTQELEDTLITCIKRIQESEHKEEIERLKQNKQVKKKSSLRSLNPYLDEKQILRVGGRLRHMNLPANRKHPIILGSKNSLTPLIIADAHEKTLHGGVQLMLSYLRSKYWILRAKALVKAHIHKCLICARLNAIAKTQMMGDLPAERVTPSRPFLHSGVDFAGPFQILMSKGRGNKTVKAYVAIFICLAVKAIHIELVGDLTAEAFIGAFRRFVSRRGKCSHLWSDQGRNFVAANKELLEAWNEAKLQFSGQIADTLAADGTQWKFIPAYSPNFGGLWEAGVKSH